MTKEKTIADTIQAIIFRGMMGNDKVEDIAKCVIDVVIEVEKNHRHHLNLDLWENVKSQIENNEK